MTEVALTVEKLAAEHAMLEAHERAARAEAEEKRRAEQRALAEALRTNQLTEADKHAILDKIRQAYLAGKDEVMIAHLPSDLCDDSGRRINNHLDGWLGTLPPALRHLHAWWEAALKPGGFGFSARIIDFPDGIPGDVGIFIGWPSPSHLPE